MRCVVLSGKLTKSKLKMIIFAENLETNEPASKETLCSRQIEQFEVSRMYMEMIKLALKTGNFTPNTMFYFGGRQFTIEAAVK